MGNVNALLTERLNHKKPSSKMTKMAQASATGNLTSFSGIFSITDLSEKEKEFLETILTEFANETQNPQEDLPRLIQLTSEVKAINNQAVILHGERIKKVHDILIHYKEGAFTAWLLAAYGNRQTPYNFMQYYELHAKAPKKLHPIIESMPRQAVYTLASREGPLEKKLEMIEGYQGETKSELLSKIRELFPLPPKDRRRSNFKEVFFQEIYKIERILINPDFVLTKNEKKAIKELLLGLLERLENKVAKS